MRFQVTVRYGGGRQRYHTFVVEAPDAAAALRGAADETPPEIARDADLVELRIAVDPDDRTYLGEEGSSTAEEGFSPDEGESSQAEGRASADEEGS